MKTWWLPFAVVGTLVGIWCMTGPHPGVVQNGNLTATSRDAAYHLGEIAYQEGRLIDAQIHFEEALEFDPGFMDALSARSICLMAQAGQEKNLQHQQAMMREVIIGLLEVAEKRPGTAQDWQTLSVAFHNAGMEPEAQIALQRAQEMSGQ